MERSYNNNLHKGANGKLYEFSRELRQVETEAEKALWKLLRNKKLNGLKFRRQHPLSNYIADFYCHEKRLVIELDGAVHDIKENAEYDNVRTYQLKQDGISVVRFRNEEVMNDIENVIKKVREVAINDE
jgi:very-short-patch-repair endonuclease